MPKLTMASFILVLIGISTLSYGQTAPYDQKFVRNLALTFRAYGDRDGFARFLELAKSNNPQDFSSDKLSALTTFSHPIKPSEGSEAIIAGAELIPHADKVIDFVSKAGKYASGVAHPTKWGYELTEEEMEGEITDGLNAATRNGRARDLLAGADRRFDSKISAGQFSDSVTSVSNNETLIKIGDKALKAARQAQDTSNEAAQVGLENNEVLTQQLLPRIKKIENDNKDVKKWIKRQQETKAETDAEKKLNAEYLHDLADVENDQLKLNLFGSFAKFSGHGALVKPIAVAQLILKAKGAFLTYQFSSGLPAAQLATMPNPGLVLASEWSAAFLAGIQIFGSDNSAEESAFEAIFEQLKLINQKLDYLISLSEANFRTINRLLNQNAFRMNQVIEKLDAISRFQKSESVSQYVFYANDQLDKLSAFQNDCKDKNSSFCNSAQIFHDISGLLDTQKSMLYPFENNLADNLETFILPASNPQLEDFHRYNMNRLVVKAIKGILNHRLTSPDVQTSKTYPGLVLAAAQSNYLQDISKRVEIDENSLVNGAVWKSAVDTITSKGTHLNRPPKELLVKLLTEGRQLLSYYDKFGGEVYFHDAMNFELQLTAKEMDSVLRTMVTRYIEKYVPTVVNIGNGLGIKSPEYEDIKPGGFPADSDSNIGNGLYDLGAQFNIPKLLYENPKTVIYGWYILLEKLGFGQLYKTNVMRVPSPTVRSAVPVEFRYKFRWKDPKLAITAGLLNKNEDTSTVLVLNGTIPEPFDEWEGSISDRWQRNHHGEQDFFFAHMQISSRTDTDYINKLRQLVWLYFSTNVASEFSAIISDTSKETPLPDDKKEAPLQENLDAIRILKKKFQDYRFRFHVYEAMVKQAELEDRVNVLCPLAISDILVDAKLSPMSIHPRALIARLETGDFMHSTMQRFVYESARSGGQLICKFSPYPKFLLDGMQMLTTKASE